MENNSRSDINTRLIGRMQVMAQAANNTAARNPDIDHMRDCAPVSAMAVMLDGLVVGNGLWLCHGNTLTCTCSVGLVV